jgi:NADH:ubiquinone oxidoreductase subunit C
MKYTDNQAAILRQSSKLLRQIQQDLPGLVYSTVSTPDGMILRTSPSKLRALALFLRNSSRMQFRTLVDIAVVDKLHPVGRFAVNYLFLSMITNQRITIQLFANETTTIPSLASPFANGQRLFAAAC